VEFKKERTAIQGQVRYFESKIAMVKKKELDSTPMRQLESLMQDLGLRNRDKPNISLQCALTMACIQTEDNLEKLYNQLNQGIHKALSKCYKTEMEKWNQASVTRIASISREKFNPVRVEVKRRSSFKFQRDKDGFCIPVPPKEWRKMLP
jgi:hypothetical protein